MERDPGSVMWELCQGDRFRVDGRIPFQAARLGDLSAKKVLHRYLEGLSIGLINLVNILQPEIICLGGGISNAEDDLLHDPCGGWCWRAASTSPSRRAWREPPWATTPEW